MNNLQHTLRPHHAVCLALFSGKGYNALFSQNMQSVLSNFKTHPDTIIELSLVPDSICKCCPNLVSKCSADMKKELLDVKWLQALNLREGDLLSWKSLQNLVSPHLKNDDALERICGSCECEWLWLCKSLRSSVTQHK